MLRIAMSARGRSSRWNRLSLVTLSDEGFASDQEEAMGFGRGILLWLLGVPLPIILLLALFWHH
jgi:hypothetical protein